MRGALILVKALSRIHLRVRSLLALSWHNLTNFGFHCPLPLSTIIYGRILTLESPTRLRLGRRCRVGDSSYFATARAAEILVGDDVNINLGCVFVACELIRIGSRTSIAEYVSIRDQEHRVAAGMGTRDQGYRVAPILIGENVWIGRGAYIGPGTVLGDGCVVAANSVVKGQFPPNVLVAGAPAVIKRSIG